LSLNGRSPDRDNRKSSFGISFDLIYHSRGRPSQNGIGGENGSSIWLFVERVRSDANLYGRRSVQLTTGHMEE